MFSQVELPTLALFVRTQKQIGSPASSSDEKRFAVDAKQAMPLPIDFGRHFANAKLDLSVIAEKSRRQLKSKLGAVGGQSQRHALMFAGSQIYALSNEL